jgi:GMP reductase
MSGYIETEYKLQFENVMIKPCLSDISSRSNVNLERTFTFKNNFESLNKREITWKGIPIISANMDTTGTFEVYKVLSQYKILTAMNKFYTLTDYQNCGLQLDPDYFMVSTGITDANYANLNEILDQISCKWICIDVANGYTKSFINFCIKIREKYPNKIIVAGNVCTVEAVDILLYTADVDIVKIGIGPGLACLTRMKTGIGIPQFSAIVDCKKNYIISDGGIKSPGDMAKAFCGGADFVMVGSEFAGHDENPGEIIEENNQKYKIFYGMSSKHAMEKHNGKMETYKTSEGAVLKIKYKGALENTVLDYLGGLRSCCTYINAHTIEEMPKNAKFVKVL